MGANDQSAIGGINDKSVTVTVDAFWMDETEITNDEYKQFITYVKDSIARRLLLMGGKEEFRMKFKNQTDESAPEIARLNWKTKIPWNSKDEETQEILSSFYYEGSNVLGIKRQVDPSKLKYRYEWINYDQAALPENKYNVNTGAYSPNAKVRVDTSYVDENGVIRNVTITRKLRTRRDLISSKIVNIYPDTIMLDAICDGISVYRKDARDLKPSFNEVLDGEDLSAVFAFDDDKENNIIQVDPLTKQRKINADQYMFQGWVFK